MYKVDGRNAQILLGYSDVFHEKAPNLISEIQKLNMHKAISVICELIALRNKKMKPVDTQYLTGVIFPLESYLKKIILRLGEASNDNLLSNPVFRKDQHIVSLQMLLLLLKKIMVYGDYQTFSQTDYTVTDEDYATILRLQLIVVDEVCQSETVEFDKGHFLYSTYHLNNRPSLAGRFLRMYYMLECLDRSADGFSYDVQNEYKNYYEDFKNKYGITTTQYSSILFWELQPYFTDECGLAHMSIWKSINSTYKKSESRETLEKALKVLSVKPVELKKWATETQYNQWDFSNFLAYPFFQDDEGRYISISDYTLSNAFFEKMFWLIRECYPQSDNEAMAFYGRLFEKYIQVLTYNANAQKENYTFVDEFSIKAGKQDIKSSDAYLKNGNCLLAIEAKGFSNLITVMTQNMDVERNYKKLFVKPVLEADKFCERAIENGSFGDVDKIYIISVTLDSIEANPFYYEKIYGEIEKNKICDKVKCYFNFSIAEYEMLMCAVESGENICELLSEYFSLDVLSPFSTFLQQRASKLPTMTKFMKECYTEASAKMLEMLKES